MLKQHLTGRSRRKKCDEKSPLCGRCGQSNRECLWPTRDELVDRRYASHQNSRYATVLAPGDQASIESSLLFRLSESVAYGQISRDLEGVAERHFVSQYYRLLILPNCHPGNYNFYEPAPYTDCVQNSSMPGFQRSRGSWETGRVSDTQYFAMLPRTFTSSIQTARCRS
jgi:hypothetical protein